MRKRPHIEWVENVLEECQKGDCMLKAFMIAIGFIALALGVVGVFIPLLPTTPFLLLTLLCFSKSSKRFHGWFTKTSLYQKYLDSYVQNRSMTWKGKLCILIPVTLILTTVAYFTGNLHVRIAIAVVLLVKYYYFCFRIPKR